MNSLLIAKNIIKRVLRGPKEIIAIIIMPVVLISVIVFALGRSSTSIPKTGIVVMDNGFFTNTMVEFIKNQNVEVVELKEENFASALKSKGVSYVILIPENFSSDIDNGKKASIDFYANNEDANTESFKQVINHHTLRLYNISETATKLSEQTSRNREDILNQLVLETSKEPLKIEYKQAYSQTNEIESANSSIGFAIIFMMLLIFTTIGIILEDKRNQTLARMFVSPVMEWEILAGNLLGSLALGLLQLIPLTFVFKIAFKIDSMYKLAGVFLIFFCFLIAIIGIGIGISGFIKKSLNPAILVATVITPTSILGGCFIPESMLPDFINKIGYAVPQKWVMKAMESILLGKDLQSIALNLIIILMFGIAFATFGLKTLRPINDI